MHHFMPHFLYSSQECSPKGYEMYEAMIHMFKFQRRIALKENIPCDERNFIFFNSCCFLFLETMNKNISPQSNILNLINISLKIICVLLPKYLFSNHTLPNL